VSAKGDEGGKEPKEAGKEAAFATSDPMEVAAELAPQQGLPYQV
jgi:hypothetical protein